MEQGLRRGPRGGPRAKSGWSGRRRISPRPPHPRPTPLPTESAWSRWRGHPRSRDGREIPGGSLRPGRKGCPRARGPRGEGRGRRPEAWGARRGGPRGGSARGVRRADARGPGATETPPLPPPSREPEAVGEPRLDRGPEPAPPTDGEMGERGKWPAKKPEDEGDLGKRGPKEPVGGTLEGGHHPPIMARRGLTPPRQPVRSGQHVL